MFNFPCREEVIALLFVLSNTFPFLFLLKGHHRSHGSGFDHSDLLGKISALSDSDCPEKVGLNPVLCPAVSKADSAYLLATLCLLETTGAHTRC